MMKKVSDPVYERIRHDVINSVYTANQRISEEELARAYGVSRTPVREALRQLERDGFVICVKNVGTFIRQISAGEISAFFDARGVLEGLTARLTAQRVTPELAEELSGLCAAVVAAHGEKKLEDANRLDTALHRRITLAAGNEYALRFLDTMSDRLMWYLNISNISRIEYMGSIPFAQMLNNHDGIIGAITAGNEAQAEERARAHVEEAKSYFIDFCYNKLIL